MDRATGVVSSVIGSGLLTFLFYTSLWQVLFVAASLDTFHPGATVPSLHGIHPESSVIMKDAIGIRFGTRVLLVLLVGTLSLAGCAKKENKDASPPVNPGNPMGGAPDIVAQLPGGEQYATGKKTYSDNNCARCHKLGTTGGGPPGGPPGGKSKGGPGGGGPDLTHVGKAADHTKEWLAEHIRNAKAHKPMSRMPPYGPDKINDADLSALADYLANQK